MREIPSDVLPRCDDTVSSLVSRLAQSSFLEDSRVLQGGRGPRRVRLNDTDYAQPRRRSWSVKVEVEGEGEDEVGSTTTSLLNYTAFGRLPEDLEGGEKTKTRKQRGPGGPALRIRLCREKNPDLDHEIS